MTYLDTPPNPQDLTIFQPLLAQHKKDRNVFRGAPMPYVLFGLIGRDHNGGAIRYEPRLHKLNVGGGQCKESAIQNCINDGMVLLDFWFPTKDDLPPPSQLESGWILEMRNGSDPFARLRKVCQFHKYGASEAHAVRNENEELKRKLAEMQGKLEQETNPNAGRSAKRSAD